MSILKNTAIRHKLILIIMGTCVGILILNNLINFSLEWREDRQEIIDSLLCYAEMVGDNCSAALAFEDAKDARETLASLRAESSIVSACIYTKEGKVLACYRNPAVKNEISPPKCTEEGYRFDADYFTLFQQIDNGSEVIGTVYIQHDLSEMRAAIMTDVATMAVVVLACSFAAYFVSLKLQQVISGPILSLAEVAKAVSEDKNYSMRAIKKSDDEVGELIDAFNEMLARIQQRDSELVEARQKLETKVQERTADLTVVNERLEKSLVHISQLAEKAVKADRAKSEFLANMSHEIRTPMNAIIGFSEILADEELTTDQKDHVNTIRNSGKHLLKLINDILDFSKIEAGKLDIKPVKHPLRNLLARIESMVHPTAVEKSLKFEVIKSDDVPATICTDPGRLQQCLINLINNAIKFTERGHVFVELSLEYHGDKSFVRFDVEDTGIGISPEKQKQIFESFTQADGSTTRKYGGTGLGLAITRQLTELMGGRIEVSSKAGEGSVFSLIMPTGVDETEQPTPEDSDITEFTDDKSEKTGDVKFKGHVLVAEDVETNQMLSKLLLNRLGLEVTIVDDGTQAVKEALSQEFDLIFMDMQMPNMNGYDATKTIRKKGVTTPVIALTANAMQGDEQKCSKAGCDDYLPKPLDQQALVSKIQKFLTCGQKESLAEQIESVKSKAVELGNLCCDDQPEVRDCDRHVIDWDQLISRLGDEQLVREVVPVFLTDNEERFEKLTEAVKRADAETIKLYAHALKGAGANIGARRLSEIVCKLERAAAEGDIEKASFLFDESKIEFEKVVSFVSKPDWIAIARQTVHSS